ncbi:transposase [Streptococcus merionis]|uniref:transposase n=1 Tax=Streptococcus merionis TaxID=400065 RepID=UPI003515315E
MPQNYSPEFKKKLVRLHEAEGRTYKSIIAEYGVSKASISKWCKELREECQTSPDIKEEYDAMKEILKLRKELEEAKKENLFLKKAAAFFAKEID